VKNFPVIFGIFGAPAAPGSYAASVTVLDPSQCPVDVFQIDFDVETRRVIPVEPPLPVDIEKHH
jgi:hypothetical protein